MLLSGHTAAELIYSRTNSDKEHMGLTNWKNSPDGLIYKYDVIIAKNYLTEEEMNNLKDLTNIFLVFAEDEAKQRHVMTMNDWINATDGKSRKEVADFLNYNDILTPSEYLNININKDMTVMKKWNSEMVNSILRNENYTGTLFQGKKKKIKLQS